jgi:hypothetical protein
VWNGNLTIDLNQDMCSNDWPAIYSAVITPVDYVVTGLEHRDRVTSMVHLHFCNIMASLYSSPWPALQGNTRLTYGPTCLRNNKWSTDQKIHIPHIALLQRKPRSRCIVLIHSTLRQHVVLIPTSFSLCPLANTHSSLSRPLAPPSFNSRRR